MTVSVLPTSIASNISELLRAPEKVEADVESRCRMGEGPDRDQVGSGSRELRRGLELTPPETSTSTRPAAPIRR